jgi:Zn-dependent peptidase ImmA (M78 family)/transcriptional regulator with XRE-family HTH domain
MISSKALGERIVEARKAAGLTQADVAKLLGMSRPTLIAVEKGTRRSSDEEIVKIAEVLGTSVHSLLRNHGVSGGAAPRFRLAPNTAMSQSVMEAVARLEKLGRDYTLLEKICGVPSVPALLESVYTFQQRNHDTAADSSIAGHRAAEFVRSTLRVGDGPFLEIDERLEAAAGVRIFYIDLPSKVAGIFLWGDEIKGCIGINAGHRHERQRWSVLHEFGHYLRDREAGDILTDDVPSRLDASEVFAESFARSGLMPEAGVRARFGECQRGSGGFTVADLVSLAYEFQVSFQAMCMRLEEIGPLPRGTYERLTARRFSPEAGKTELGLPQLPKHDRLPRRYTQLAVTAFDRAEISESELADFLRVDRITARGIVLDWLVDAENGTDALSLASNILQVVSGEVRR